MKITVPCPNCTGTGWKTFGDRHAVTRQDRCERCRNTGRIPAATGVSPEASAPAVGLPPDELSAEVRARRIIGRSQDGWTAWPLSPSHAPRLALPIDRKAVAELEAFSVTGPWYANANSPDGKGLRLGAGGSHDMMADLNRARTKGLAAAGARR